MFTWTPDIWVFGDEDPLPASLIQAQAWYARGLIRVQEFDDGVKRWVLTDYGHEVLARGRTPADRRRLI